MATNASRYTMFTSPSRYLPLVYAKVVEEGNGLDTQNRSGSISLSSEDIFFADISDNCFCFCLFYIQSVH